jgi:hypothetical protein
VAGFRNRHGEGGGRGSRGSRNGQGPSARPAPGGGLGPGAGPVAGPGQQPYGAPTGEPEYYAPGAGGQGAGGHGGAGGQGGGYDDAPGQTRAFTLGVPEPLAYEAGYPGPGDAYAGQPPYPYGDDNVATYRAGQAAAPPVGPRLHWKQLLRGILLHPGRTFWQMRDHTVWGPALTVTFIYGLLAVFGFDAARSDVLDATLSTSIPWVLTTAVAVVISAITLGAVTNTLARQFGGDGAWAPTIGLSLLVTTLTDAPRLFFALFLGGANSFVQLLGWLTWLACAALLTSMVSKSHDLPWPKALGAASIQLVALLCLFKLPLI